ncbi:MAG: SLC13 family permease [Candidatus Eiseniibacteriota bacterium]
MEIAIVLGLLVLTIANFAWEWIAIEVFAMLLMGALVIAGVLTPQEAASGFGNSAVVMIAGVMLLTGAILDNGAAAFIATRIRGLAGGSERKMGVYLLGAVNAVSSVINNVAATATFIPVAEAVARQFRVSRAKYLMPIAFASMTGGMCTLIGTSTNVAVSGALAQHGLRPMSFFELTPVGVAVALIGIPYLLLVVPRLVRPRPELAAIEAYGLRAFLYEVLVGPDAAIIGESMSRAALGEKLGVTVLAIERGTHRIEAPEPTEVIRAGDILLVEGSESTIPAVRGTKGLDIHPMPKEWQGLEGEGVTLMEATVSYNSPFIGKSLTQLEFRRRYHLTILAIHRRGHVAVDRIIQIPLRAGDVLLVYGRKDMFERLAAEPHVVLTESTALQTYDGRKCLQASAVFAAAIVVAALDWLDSPTAFLTGAGLVMAIGLLKPSQAGEHVNVRFLVMLAGMATLGLAMEKSGAARLLAVTLTDAVPGDNPLVLMATFYLLTVLLTQPLSNAAAALLVIPIALEAAPVAGADPRSFAIAVCIAASCSFITPFEPACLLVYSTGRYRVRDFLVAGAGLTVLAFAACLFLIPMFWPLS